MRGDFHRAFSRDFSKLHSISCKTEIAIRASSGFILLYRASQKSLYINPLTPNDRYIGRTAPLTSKRCILYIYSTDIGIEYFKHGIYPPLLSLQNAVCFIIITYLVSVLFTFYIQCVLKFKKNNSGAKRLSCFIV